MGKIEEIEKKFNNYFALFSKNHIPPEFYIRKEEFDSLLSEIHRLRQALQEISEGKGRYDMDNYQHAKNTIEDMKELAVKTLEAD